MLAQSYNGQTCNFESLQRFLLGLLAKLPQKSRFMLLNRNPIDSWYRPGQTWTGLFGDIATTVDECRAECVGAYLMSDTELLALFGYTIETDVTCKDCKCARSMCLETLAATDCISVEYNMYMQLGIAGLRALENYSAEDDVGPCQTRH